MRSKAFPIAAIQCAVFAFAVMLCGQNSDELPAPVTLIQVDPHHESTLVAGTATA